MSKDDVELRPRPPKKRKQLREALDAELAVWAQDASLTPSERRRAEEERQRRKQPGERVIVLLRVQEGLTPPQKEAVKKYGRVPAFNAVDGYQELLKASRPDMVVACPKEMHAGGSVWAAVRYARHRGIPVVIYWPDGREEVL